MPASAWNTELFEPFFASAHAESKSPFLKPAARLWGRNLPLRVALGAALLWVASVVAVLVGGWSPAAYLLCSAVYFLVGTRAAIKVVEQLRERHLEIDGLMVVAALAAALIGSPLEGSLLLVLFSTAESVERWVDSRMRDALVRLQKAHPLKARLMRPDGTLVERAVEDVLLDSTLLVRAGETVPLDGQMVEGTSSIHLAHLTGEARPKLVTVGDLVPSGAVNCEGALLLRVTQPHGSSTLSRLLKLVEEAHEKKLPLQRWLERFQRGYAVSVMSATLLLALFGGSLYKAIVFLVTASPCALLIAVPVVALSSLSSCARRGIVVKGSGVLDQLARCRHVAFDKTGTLTEGTLSCEAIEPQTPGITVEEAIALAAGLEMRTSHPIARAIESLATERGISPAVISDFIALPGVAVEGVADWHGKPQRVRIGAPGITLTIADQKVVFKLRDQLRESSPGVITSLHNLGLTSCILSGDQSSQATAIGRRLGIAQTQGDLLPHQKMEQVAALSQSGCMMVGDGINDAPALARATVGIAMGRPGQTAALEAADIVLLRDDLEQLPWLVSKARAGRRLLKQNVTLALTAMVLGSAAALWADLPLWAGVLLHEGGTLLVSCNGLRQLRQ